MAQQSGFSRDNRALASVDASEGHAGIPADIAAVLDDVRQHLASGDPQKALDVIKRSKLKSHWLTNAVGVCRIRLGDAASAVELFRGLVVKQGILLRDDVPTKFKLNFAAALLASGNADGFLAVLSEIREAGDQSVVKYKDAYTRWRASLSPWDRIKGLVGGASRPFVAEFPLGEV